MVAGTVAADGTAEAPYKVFHRREGCARVGGVALAVIEEDLTRRAVQLAEAGLAISAGASILIPSTPSE